MNNIKGRKKKNSVVKNMILLVMFAVSMMMLYSMFGELKTMQDLNSNIQAGQNEESKLEEEKELLKTTKENLNNPEYILKYARGKYLATGGDGEQVFRLPEEE